MIFFNIHSISGRVLLCVCYYDNNDLNEGSNVQFVSNDFREWTLLILEALVCAAVELYCALLRCVSNNLVYPH